MEFLRRGHGDHGPKTFALPRLPPLFIHSAYNVSYTTGVVAPQVVQINYNNIASYLHLEFMPPHLCLPKNSPLRIEC